MTHPPDERPYVFLNPLTQIRIVRAAKASSNYTMWHEHNAQISHHFTNNTAISVALLPFQFSAWLISLLLQNRGQALIDKHWDKIIQKQPWCHGSS